MWNGRIYLKISSLFYDNLSNEPNFGRIFLAELYL